MMEFIVCDKDRYDIGMLPSGAYLDIDIGDTDDYKIELGLQDYNREVFSPGNYFYCIGTEYGGRINNPEVNTSDNSISFEGQTFRGMLRNRPILPPSGSAYKISSGDLNEIINDLVGTKFGNLFIVETALAGKTINNYKHTRYINVLDGITEMLKSVGYRLNIEAADDNGRMRAKLSAVPIVDHSELYETSQDGGINFRIKKVTDKYNYMLCLGRGELANRDVIRLHLKDDGTVEEGILFPYGEDTKIYVYDYPSVESHEDLLKAGIQQFADINETDSQSMTIKDDMELELGDIVGGRDYITGMYIKEPITGKIIKMQRGNLKISYKIGEGD